MQYCTSHRSQPSLATIPESDLLAIERDAIWHVTAKLTGHDDPVDVLSFSRRDGKVLSGDL